MAGPIKREKFQIRCTAEFKAALDEYCKFAERDLSVVVREAVLEYLVGRWSRLSDTCRPDGSQPVEP